MLKMVAMLALMAPIVVFASTHDAKAQQTFIVCVGEDTGACSRHDVWFGACVGTEAVAAGFCASRRGGMPAPYNLQQGAGVRYKRCGARMDVLTCY